MSYPGSARPMPPHPHDLYVSPEPYLAWWWLLNEVPGGHGHALHGAESEAWAQDSARRPRGPIRRVLVVVSATSFDSALMRSATRLLLLRAAFTERVPAVLVLVGKASADQTAAAQRMIDRLTHDDGLRSPGVQITLRRELPRTQLRGKSWL